MENKKKVLLFMRPMHGYGEEVVQNLQARGFDVTHYRHTSKAPKKQIGLKARAVRWPAKNINSSKLQQLNLELEKIYYTSRFLNSLNQYDFILSIGGCCSENFMMLVAENTNTKKHSLCGMALK